MIKPCNPQDFDRMLAVVNDAAMKYRGHIPADCWKEPYMPAEELRSEIEDGIKFWGYYDPDLVGVMGIQDKGKVTLIRHAYVLTERQGQGIGGRLLKKLMGLTDKPLLVGTWKAATWAVGFYEKNGFTAVPEENKNMLLRKYWNIPERQVAASTVLADERALKVK